MTKLLLLFNCFFVIIISNAQSSHELILRYHRPKMYSDLYFGGGVAEEIVFYESFEEMMKFQKFVFVEIDVYKKKLRQNRQYIKYQDGKFKYKIRRSVWTIPRRFRLFFHRLSNSFFNLFEGKSVSASPIEIQYEKDSLNRIISSQLPSWKEFYQYDINRNLIKIDANVIPDSSKVLNIFYRGFDCPLLWDGKFENGNITEEIINWSNGHQDIIKHRWENDLLIESSTAFNIENIYTHAKIKYYYDYRKILKRIEYFDKTGKLMRTKKFKWK